MDIYRVAWMIFIEIKKILEQTYPIYVPCSYLAGNDHISYLGISEHHLQEYLKIGDIFCSQEAISHQRIVQFSGQEWLFGPMADTQNTVDGTNPAAVCWVVFSIIDRFFTF